eukprot:347081-Chlamydomonas_euryale.AAC.1
MVGGDAHPACATCLDTLNDVGARNRKMPPLPPPSTPHVSALTDTRGVPPTLGPHRRTPNKAGVCVGGGAARVGPSTPARAQRARPAVAAPRAAAQRRARPAGAARSMRHPTAAGPRPSTAPRLLGRAGTARRLGQATAPAHACEGVRGWEGVWAL